MIDWVVFVAGDNEERKNRPGWMTHWVVADMVVRAQFGLYGLSDA